VANKHVSPLLLHVVTHTFIPRTYSVGYIGYLLSSFLNVVYANAVVWTSLMGL
jgi:hypothetical protein